MTLFLSRHPIGSSRKRTATASPFIHWRQGQYASTQDCGHEEEAVETEARANTPSCCPICGVVLRSRDELRAHVSAELEDLDKVTR